MLLLKVLDILLCFFFFKQKTAYEMRISDWSSDVCSSDLGKTFAEDRDRMPFGLFLAFAGVEVLPRFGRDRKSVVLGKSESVRVDLGGRRIIKKKKYYNIAKRRIKQDNKTIN